MSNDELLTDDYVADLLAKEANDCSLKYSAMGLEAFNTKYKPSNAPKPNKRFLRNIIKDTDTHNKALLAKEAAESRARLKDLERAEEAKRRKTDPTAGDIRRRQLGNIQSILGGSRHRRGDNTRTAADEGKSRTKSDGDRHSHRSSRRERDASTERRKPRKDYGRLSRSPSDERRTYHEDQSRSSRRRHRDSSSEDKRRHAHDRQRDRSRSPRRRRSRSPRTKRSKHRSRSPLAAEKQPSRDLRNDGDESDPLEEFIGPAPPPKYRGRGTVAGTASLDRRFSDSYDPSTDVLPDKDEDNWDDAVEAYRDRQKLRRTQEERMRAAGFADHQIQRINNSQREKTEEDVVWSKAGEKREWDRGKGQGGDDDGDDIVLRGILSEEL
ncbi:pre-mrna-splicing factor 38b [Trichoderma arundinaceum]|uniref:Pre-mrna-splicing factor 38b n=1 Tax=Trichoderma arundinaceum TaxID=490622 RepID=A0A395NLW6_TRIAR|nr:pre-mrna-splicing factor 38b [Trichoderma arundinaceum]